jgi:hypothetical protein
VRNYHNLTLTPLHPHPHPHPHTPPSPSVSHFKSHRDCAESFITDNNLSLDKNVTVTFIFTGGSSCNRKKKVDEAGKLESKEREKDRSDYMSFKLC